MFDPRIFSMNLRAARSRMGFSQKELAQQLYISTQAVSKWERGEAVPELAHICSLSELLHISVDDLVGIVRDEEPSLIAVDGGGTKTEFALISVSGKLLKRLVLPGSNPNTCTIKGTCDILCRGIDTLLREGTRVLAIYVGGAGFFSSGNGEAVEEQLRKSYPGMQLWCTSDICNVLACAKDPDNAIAVICGTGSVVFATKQGSLLRCGGSGWRLETLGSGYDLGRCAILAALEHRDGTGPETALTEAVEQKLGGSVWNMIDKLYSENAAFIASFAPLVIRAWEAGDAVALRIVEDNARRLAQLVHAAAAQSPAATQVLLGGSLLTECKPFREALIALINPALQPGMMQYPQIWGACLRCASLAKLPEPDVNLFMDCYIKEVNYAEH